MTLALFGTFSCYLHLCLAKYFNLRINVQFPWFSACFLEMLTYCYEIMVLVPPAFSLWVTKILAQNFRWFVQTQIVQITLWCSGFNAVHIGEIQGPPPHFTICLRCARQPRFGPCFRKLSPFSPKPMGINFHPRLATSHELSPTRQITPKFKKLNFVDDAKQVVYTGVFMGAEFKYGIFCAHTTPSMCFDQVLFQTLSKPSAVFTGFLWNGSNAKYGVSIL